jgi:hypothetical protein
MKASTISRVAFAFMVATASAQVGQRIQVTGGCAFVDSVKPGVIFTFESDQEARAVVTRVLATSSLAQNFVLRAVAVGNAAATISNDGKREIHYSQEFFENVKRQTNSVWSAISIIAHEVGHHVNGDVWLGSNKSSDRHLMELEADRFSGATLQKLGASLDEAQIAMRYIGSPSASETHPAKQDRLAAIANGWTQSNQLPQNTVSRKKDCNWEWQFRGQGIWDYFVKPCSVVRAGDSIEVETLIDSPKPVMLIGGKEYFSRSNKATYECNKKTISFKERLFFSERMGKGVGTPLPDGGVHSIQPNTQGEHDSRFFCGKF